jgi:HlyD family secretion protein
LIDRASKRIELKSEELQEVLGKSPSWLVRVGTGILLFVILVAIVGSFFIKYPDLIQAKIVITSKQPPIPLIARASGKLIKLFIADNAEIAKGDVLAILENSASYSDVFTLEEQLKQIEAGLLDDPLNLGRLELDQNANLGQMQLSYSTFLSKLFDYTHYVKSNYRVQQMLSIKAQISGVKKYEVELLVREKILRKDLSIVSKQLERDSLLFNKKMISAAEYERSNSDFLKSLLPYSSIKSEILNVSNQLTQYANDLSELEAQSSEQQEKLLNDLKETYNNLQQQIKEWKLSYVIIAPIAGNVTFHNYYEENQFVTQQDILFTVIPLNKNKMLGRISLPISGYGKVRPHQRAFVSLDSYPSKEYGAVLANVVSISALPSKTQEGVFYTVIVDFPKGLKTSYNKNIGFSQEMQGQAEIITNERRLIERFFDPISSVISKQKM